VLQGFQNDQDFKAVENALLKCPIIEIVGEKIGLAKTKSYRFLHSLGITIRKTIDCLIATFCIENHIELLHTGRNFTPFEEHLNLRVAHPKSSFAHSRIVFMYSVS